jgi:hypothetical protein
MAKTTIGTGPKVFNAIHLFLLNKSQTAKIVAKILRRRTEMKTRIYSENISLDLEEEKEPGIQLGC